MEFKSLVESQDASLHGVLLQVVIPALCLIMRYGEADELGLQRHSYRGHRKETHRRGFIGVGLEGCWSYIKKSSARESPPRRVWRHCGMGPVVSLVKSTPFPSSLSLHQPL